ncbi:protein-disulfide reductase DsbD [Paracoccus sp. KR1-242]|uniref:protein-disulfide reductase DsbD n=1 Tax=Paracoccus sp. KR1-242 TaxID=3410028 RepID=UPI003C0EE75E
MTKLFLRIAFLAIHFALAGPLGLASAQEFSFSDRGRRPMDPRDAFKIELRLVRDGRAEIDWQIAPGYYLYRDQIAASDADGRALTVETPAGVIKEDPNFGTVEVYYDAASAVLPQAGGRVQVTWQGCQEDGICYAPVTSDLDLPVLTQPPPDIAEPLQFSAQDGLVSGLAQRGGTALVLLAFFGFGLALALTPCVFPMIPILAAMLARQGEALTPARGALLSGTYVLAMAAAFGAMGAVAGWSGQNLQMVLQSAWAIGAVALLFVVLALSSFGLFQMQLPAAMTARLSGGTGRRGSVAGAATLGFTSALIVGPCVTAPLAGALLYIAQTGDAALGAVALIALGLGQGAPLFVAGTFGARILPRAGAWMQHARQFFGVVFLAMAIWLAGRLLPGPLVLLLWAVLLVGCGVFLGALDRAPPATNARQLGRAAGVVALMGGAVMGIGAALGATEPLRPLSPLVATSARADAPALAFDAILDADQLQRKLGGADQPSLIYVTADWCVACKGIERSVLPDPGVAKALQGMRLLKADVSDGDDQRQALMRKLGAAGPPTMIFLDANGREPEGNRLVGSVNAAQLVHAANRAKVGG